MYNVCDCTGAWSYAMSAISRVVTENCVNTYYHLYSNSKIELLRTLVEIWAVAKMSK